MQARLRELEPIYQSTTYGAFVTRAGQALEIAIFRALQAQQSLSFLGHFRDLDEHEDDTMYSKEEPPSALSSRQIQTGKLDFLLAHPIAGWAGIEAKNIREWLYPNREEVMDLLAKCCDIQVIPVLVARRIAYATFSLLHLCGVVVHQTYNQLYPSADQELAKKASDKRLLGYHDIRLGNQPDPRLLKFVQSNLPRGARTVPAIQGSTTALRNPTN